MLRELRVDQMMALDANIYMRRSASVNDVDGTYPSNRSC